MAPCAIGHDIESRPQSYMCSPDSGRIMQGLTLSIWFTCPSGMWFWKFTCPAKIFTCRANICTSPVKLMYTAGKISACPDWKITCPVGHVTTKVYVPWEKIYMPRACRHALMSSPVMEYEVMKHKSKACLRYKKLECTFHEISFQTKGSIWRKSYGEIVYFTFFFLKVFIPTHSGISL